MTSFAVLSFSFSLVFYFFRFVLVFYHFFVLVIVFVNEFVIFSFFTIFVFVNENHIGYSLGGDSQTCHPLDWTATKIIAGSVVQTAELDC